MRNTIGIGNYVKQNTEAVGMTISEELRNKVVAACIPTGNNDSPNRERIKDLSGNGNDFILSNFEFTDSQGYGKYPWNFSGFFTDDLESGRDVDSKYEIVLRPGKSFWNSTKKVYPSTLIEVSGLVESGILSVSCIRSSEDTSISRISISTNGRHRLPASYINENVKDSFGFRNNSSYMVKIRIIPEYEGAICLDYNILSNGKLGTIACVNPFLDIIKRSQKFTIISFIVPFKNFPSHGAFYSYIRNINDNYLLRIDINQSFNKPFILAQRHNYETSMHDSSLVLGDLSSGYTAQNTYASLENIEDNCYYSVAGTINANFITRMESSNCAWYGTIIANDCLTEDEILQLVQYYDLDKSIKPIIYYDIDKQQLSDGELDKLIDYSLNDNDAKVTGVILPNEDFPGEVVFGNGKYATLNKELNLLDSTLVLDREYRNVGQFTPIISNSESNYDTNTPFLMEHFSNNEVWSYGKHTNVSINTNRAVTYLSKFKYHNSNYVLNIEAGTYTGGSGLCIGGKVNEQTAGDMFFHKLLLYPYSMHVDLLKRQLKKLKIKNNF